MTKFRASSGTLPWLYQIATNYCLNELRAISASSRQTARLLATG